MPPILEIRDLNISFTQYAAGLGRRRLEAVRGLSLRLEAGEVAAVVGASGAGKSLLAHAILDILPYNSQKTGEILYRGEPLSSRRAQALRGREIVLVPQGVTYLDPLMKVGPQAGEGRAALARYGLGPEVENLYPFELSGGMARRVLLAAAAGTSPKLVVADEPTPGLDAQAARRVLGHFQELAAQGAGVLFITHELDLAMTIANQLIVLQDGKIAPPSRARTLWDALPQNRFAPIPEPRPAGEALEVRDLAFAYPRRRVLSGLSFTLRAGERLGLFAPSGRGKTTLCRLLAGYERPDGGEIRWAGRPLGDWRGPSPVQLLWQHPEQAVDPRLPLGETLREAGPLDEALLAALDISPSWLARYPAELSGGELQRLCIARALAVRPRILLCDETTSMLDPLSQARIWSFLTAWARDHQLGLLIVSHNRNLLKRLCPRILEL